MRKKNTGSLTVECALVIPVFIMAFLSLLSMFEMLEIYCRMEAATEAVAEEEAVRYTSNGGVYDEDELRIKIEAALGEKWCASPILEKGADRVSFQTECRKDNDALVLKVSYRLRPWYAPDVAGGIAFANSCRVSLWEGYSLPDTGQTVYITPAGSVYHLYRDCSYLKADVQSVIGAGLSEARDLDGARYYPCEFCCRSGEADPERIYYITPYGRRYHTDPVCKALHKNIREIQRNEVNGRSVCKKCEERERNE